MQTPLKLGFFIQPVHPPSRPYADVLREDREAVVLADRLGYCEAFIGEHLVDAAETITSSLAFIASMADACPSIIFGTGVLPLANYHPAMAAAQVAMVDHLVQGRLVLGVGPGVAGDAEAMGDLGSDRRRKTQEALDHMCRIWREAAPYRIEGEFYRTTTERSLDPAIGVGVAIRPLQRPHPPIAITSIRPDAGGPHAHGRLAVGLEHFQHPIRDQKAADDVGHHHRLRPADIGPAALVKPCLQPFVEPAEPLEKRDDQLVVAHRMWIATP